MARCSNDALGVALTIVGIELLDDAQVRELTDQLAVPVHSQLALLPTPRGRRRAAVIPAPLCLQPHAHHCEPLQASLHSLCKYHHRML